ncbi:MAG: pirin family protein [Chloroflexi bacterium]|nr:pirin family protein [Chloroflexota bacterium]
MPALTPENPIVLPRIPVVDASQAAPREVERVIDAPTKIEGEGFQVRRPFPSADLRTADPFLLLDHWGAVEYAPGEAKGAPWHPHRGFETVTYVMDGAIRHRDSLGGGGLIKDGATQWMTAGAGILHDELPTEEIVTKGGLFHAVQLWVNLPKTLKMTAPRYQDVGSQKLTVLGSHDGGAWVRLIAGEMAGHRGPGVTWTPIAYAHATITPGAQLQLPWRPDFNALVYVLAGRGATGPSARPLREGQLAVVGAGDFITIEADAIQDSRTPGLDVLVLGGQPIREPAVFYGPFVMNTHDEIVQAIADYRSGRMGTIPVTTLAP